MIAQANSAVSFEVLLIIFTIAVTCASAGFLIGYRIGKNAKN